MYRTFECRDCSFQHEKLHLFIELTGLIEFATILDEIKIKKKKVIVIRDVFDQFKDSILFSLED